MRSTPAFLVFLVATASTALAQFEVGRLLAHDGQSDDRFGSAIDISGDTIVVGAPEADGVGPSSGAAYVFRRVNGSWIEEAKLLPSDPTAAGHFGASVSVEGSRAVIGAPQGNGVATGSGAAYVFRRTGTFPFAVWTQQAKLAPVSALQGDGFGASVSLSGATAAVGAPDGQASSAIYFFGGGAGNWLETGRIPPSGSSGVNACLGRSLCLEGDTLLCANIQAPNGTWGVVNVYRHVGGAWTLEADLSQPSVEGFGQSIALDGDTAVVGAPTYRSWDPIADHRGALFIFRRSGVQWSPPTMLQSTPPVANGRIGESVAVSGSNVFGGSSSFPYLAAGYNVGRAFMFQCGSAGWQQLGDLLPASPFANSGFGCAMAIDGETVAVGCYGGGSFSTGSAIVLSLVPPSPVVYCTAKVNSQGCTPAMFFQGSAAASGTQPFLLTAQSVLNNENGILFFGVSGQTAFPFQGGTLCVLPPIRRTPIQNSGGNVGPPDCSGTYSLDFNAIVRSGTFPDLVAGVLVNSQYWSRDPASPSTTGLTNAVEFGIGF